MNFLTCQHCKGQNDNCPVCHGWRVVMPLEGKILYWQKKLSRGFIYNSQILKSIRKIIDTLLYIFVALVLVVMAYFLFRYLQAGGELTNFFLKKHWLLQIFWLANLVALYIFYRMSKTGGGKLEAGSWRREAGNEIDNFDQDEIWQKDSQIEKIDIARAFSYQCLDLIEKSYLLAQKLNQELLPSHILYQLLDEREVKGYFFRLGVDVKNLKQRLEGVFSKIHAVGTIELFLFAYQESYNTNQPLVNIEEILVSLAKQKSTAQEILYDLEIDEQKLKNVVEWSRIQKRIAKYWRQLQTRASSKPKSQVNRAYTAVASPFLNQFSEDLTQYARAGYIEPCLGKEKELKSIFSSFNSGKSGVILVGERGTGKSFVIDSLAELMAAEDVPRILQDKRLVRLSVPNLIAGANQPGEIEARLLQILKEVKRAGNIILAIDNIDSLVGLGTETSESLDLAELLAQELEKEYFYLVAIADWEKYNSYLKQTSLGNILSIIEITEPDKNNTVRILEAKAPLLENRYQIYFTYQALEAAVDFSVKYIHHKFLPAKAVDLIERAAQLVRQNKGKKAIVLAEDVAQVTTEITKIPVTRVTQIESQKLLNLEQAMHQRVVDQEEAVKFVAQALRRARARLREDKRPMASFLFLGPTGVGKTEVARTLSEIYFGGEENMIRLDMSEYSGSDGASKLIGQAGDKESQGYLTQLVEEQPFALILLDEFEKADSQVYNLFLQVMEDGRLTEAGGKTVDFTNTIIIATSNAGTDLIQQSLKNNQNIEQIKKDLIENHLSKYFKPELLNRFDGIVVFKPLSMSEVEQITVLMLNKLIKNLADKGIELAYSQQAVAEIARAGFEPALGARPLRRVIQDKIENQIANLILANQVQRRDKIILKSLNDIKVEKAIS